MAPTAKRLQVVLGTALGILLSCAVVAIRSTAQEPPEAPADGQPPAPAPTSGRSAKQDEIRSLFDAAEAYRVKGQMNDAIVAYQQAEGIAREIGDRDLLASGLNQHGLIYRYLADYHQAVALYTQALEICRSLRNVLCQARTLHNLGVTYTYLGELQAAQDRLGDALVLWQTKYEESMTLTALGTVYDLQGQPEKAIDQLRQAFRRRHQTPGIDANKRRRGKAATLDRLATAFKNANRMDDARKTYQTSLALWQGLDERPDTAVTRANLGWLYVDWEQPDAALLHFKQALPIFEKSQLQQQLAHALLGMGHAYRQKGDLQAATDALRRAIEMTESLRRKPQSLRLRASFLAHREKFYEFYIDLLMQRYTLEKDSRYSTQALEAAERFRARSLLELLNEERAAFRSVADAEVLDLEQRLHHAMNAKDHQRLDLLHRDGPKDEIARVEKEQRYLSLQYEHLKAQLRARLPDISPPKPIEARQLQQLLDDDTLLLFYALGEDRSFLWLVSRRQIRPYHLPARKTIEAEAQKVYRWLSNSDQRGGEAAGREAAARLSEIMLGRVATALGQHRLIVVADGVLNYVPLAALPFPGSSTDSPMLDREIVSIPSASVIATLRQRADGRQPASRRLAVVADPVFGPEDVRLPSSAGLSPHGASSDAPTLPNPERLEHSAAEGEAILNLVPRKERYSAAGFEATREAILAGKLDHHRLVHLAVHGEFHDEQPEYTHLVLSLLDRQGQPLNGRLYMHEIDDLHLPADLVVLSACNTALGKLVRGEGMLGMTRVFMDAGASRVLVSLWYVDDEATARLMQKLYLEMLIEGKSAAAALRAAQSWLRDHPKWQAPYYWAGFVLQGDWR